MIPGIAAGIALKLAEKFPKLSLTAAHIVAWLGILAVAGMLIWGAIWWFTDTVGDAHDEGVKQGVTAERVEAQGKVIENVQKAKAAADDVRRDGPTVAECLQDSRVRENCG